MRAIHFRILVEKSSFPYKELYTRHNALITNKSTFNLKYSVLTSLIYMNQNHSKTMKTSWKINLQQIKATGS